jgi:Fur family ferric uptake transcriptional regulator
MIKYKSKKREKIMQLLQDGSLLTAKAICIRLPDIDRTTVYRALNALVEQGDLREIHLHKEYSQYELAHNGDTHQHFVCTNCEKILPINVDASVISKLLPKNFKAENFELNVKGTCNDCE